MVNITKEMYENNGIEVITDRHCYQMKGMFNSN